MSRSHLFVGAGSLVVAAALAAGSACTTADLTESTEDASVECPKRPAIFCDAGAAVGCVASPADPDPRVQAIPPGTYGEGCVVNFIDSYPDLRGECTLDSICRCAPVEVSAEAGVDDGSAPDGGADAGDSGDDAGDDGGDDAGDDGGMMGLRGARFLQERPTLSWQCAQ